MFRNLRRSLGLAADAGPAAGNSKEGKPGLVIGELLVAFVLLVVAISSLTALMYSVKRNPRTRSEAVECAEKGSASSPKCATVAQAKPASGSTLLLAGCATRSGSRIQACNDSVTSAQVDGTTLRSRTDSASLEMLPKKPATRKNRPDLGFVR